MTQNPPAQDSNTFVPGFLSMKKHQYLITVGMMLLFALIGGLIASFFSFQYEAEAVLITNLELVEDTNITEIMVDSQLELIRQLMFSPEITSEVLLAEEQAGNPITLDQLEKMSQVERRLNSTLVKVRHSEAQVASRIATNWVKTAYERLNEAYQHALMVSEAKWMLTSIEDCLSDELVFETNFCKTLSAYEVKMLTQEAETVILEESPLSLGLTRDIQISQFQPASLPSQPVGGNRSNWVLIGALVGLLLSFIIYELPVFRPGKVK